MHPPPLPALQVWRRPSPWSAPPQRATRSASSDRPRYIPFSTAVAEQFGTKYDFPTPVVESTGSGGGLKLFCSGVGEQHPDITNSSRRIKQSEIDTCASNGIERDHRGQDRLRRHRAGQQQERRPDERHDPADLAWRWPRKCAVDGEIKAQSRIRTGARSTRRCPTQRSRSSDRRPPRHPRRLRRAGDGRRLQEFDEVKALDEDARTQVCATMREDGAFVEAGENDNLIVQKLEANPDAFGIFGFSFLDQNLDMLQGSSINGEEPTFENIADGAYPVSRSLFLYVKNAHVGVVPGIKEFVDEFTSEAAFGEDGYLAEKGLIPLPEVDRDRSASRR